MYKVNHNIFKEESERSFYLAGFIAADGCIRISKTNKSSNYLNHRLVISLSSKDKEHLLLIRELLDSNNPISDYLVPLSKRNINWKDVWTSKLSITSKMIVEDLAKFNIGPRKTFSYEYPNWLVNHPLNYHFMRGYFDGDGSFSINTELSYDRLCASLRGTYNFLHTYKSIIERECNFKCKNNISKDKIPQLRFKGKNALLLRDFLYSNAHFYLNRKYNISFEGSIYESF